jgi:hypothetical protein
MVLCNESRAGRADLFRPAGLSHDYGADEEESIDRVKGNYYKLDVADEVTDRRELFRGIDRILEAVGKFQKATESGAACRLHRKASRADLNPFLFLD